MFDPNANAVQRYFQVNKSLAPMCGSPPYVCTVYSQPRNSAFGLQYNTVIANWMGGSESGAAATAKRKRSLTFFQAFPQVPAVFYDDSTANLDSVSSWLDAMANPGAGVRLTLDGVMYTTWNGDYTKLSAIAAKIRAHTVFGRRWPSNTP